VSRPELEPHADGGGFAVNDVPVTVAVVQSRTEAELMAGLLRAHGIKAAVLADDAGGLEPQLQQDGVRVLVAPADEDEARELIDEVNDGPG